MDTHREVLAGLLLVLAMTAILNVPASAIKLPPYVTACSRSDPKLNECVLQNGRNAIPIVIKGDPKYRVPKLNPMVIPELQLQQGTGSVGLNITWKNAEIHGIKDTEFLDVDMNVEKRHIKMHFFLPKVSITGAYTATGRVLLLPVTGSGPSNITVENMKISYDIDWNLVKKANGKEYLDVTNPMLTLLDLGHLSMKFERIFNGDKLLGDNLNTFLNENWKDLAKEFGPGVADAIGQVFGLVLKNICDLVPYDNVLKP
ncbi:protein takeout-like [Thrips palmi]|uniref:Protein takeout-like n=1 Tax=Thrips palmi TaxID=161013 RepID=A0A6P9A3B1_THRPL|nr:protein takeout-like [Thrips palmi]